MIARQRVLLIALLMTAGAMAGPVSAGVNLDIDVAPPAPRVEAAPPPRAGYVWAPGYWAWRGHRHIWVRGHWMHERRGFHWVPDQWVQAGPHWHYVPGHWER
ncbi:MAG TPA: YXWGXW repeat-containing protein [Steroidobacteraceae bacterium]